jgi:two-component sensor histidine kinase
MNQSLSKEIQERKGAQQKVLEQLQEKDALLSEIHHRVKNNLQIISSLLMLQELRTEDQTTLEILGDCQNRIRSMALIHERLYYARDLSRIDFHSYLEELAVELLRAQATDSRIRLVSDLDEVVVGVKTAFPCGLIVNELVSNCVKHAFNSSMDGEIRLSLKHDPDEGFELKVSDNGKGLPEDNDFSETPTLGLKLVRNLAEKQLKGKLSIGGDKGAEIRLTFPDQGMEANDGGRENGQGQCDDS